MADEEYGMSAPLHKDSQSLVNTYFPVVADPGYCTATESLYESGLSDNCRERNEGNLTDRDSSTLNDSGTHESIVSDVTLWFTIIKSLPPSGSSGHVLAQKSHT